MTAGAPEPGSAEWMRLITASKVAAILGVSPWDSPRSLFHKMRGETDNDDGQNQGAKARGHYLENGILDWWEDQHKGEFTVIRRQLYVTDPNLPWAAATPDLVAGNEHNARQVVVDAKTARFDTDWGEEGTDQIPPYYDAQMQWQMHLTGAKHGYIALLTAGLELREYPVEYNEAMASVMEGMAYEFWKSVQSGDAPALDGHKATLTTVRKLHADIDRDLTVELEPEVAVEFADATIDLKAAEERERQARAVVIEKMGKARMAVVGDTKVARRQPNKYGVSLVPLIKSGNDVVTG